MTPISARYALAIAALALAAGIPVVLHSQRVLDRDDCRDPDAMRELMLVPGSSVEPADDKSDASILQRSKGTLNVGRANHRLRFAVVRTLEPLRILHRPERLVVTGLDVKSSELRWAEREGARLPIHWVESKSTQNQIAIGYTYVYGQRAVANPRLALLGSGLRRLFTGARPLTVLVAGGWVRGDRESVVRAAEDWLFAAWDGYRTVCGPEGDAAGAVRAARG